MGAGGGVLLASRLLLSATPTNKLLTAYLHVLQHPLPLSPHVALRVVVGLMTLIGTKNVSKLMISAVVQSFLPPQNKEDGNKRKKKEHMTSAQALTKYLEYFAVGAAVVLHAPIVWYVHGM